MNKYRKPQKILQRLEGKRFRRQQPLRITEQPIECLTLEWLVGWLFMRFRDMCPRITTEAVVSSWGFVTFLTWSRSFLIQLITSL